MTLKILHLVEHLPFKEGISDIGIVFIGISNGCPCLGQRDLLHAKIPLEVAVICPDVDHHLTLVEAYQLFVLP
jgi:hypothetical protein